tara:strand:- start:278 stop:682 length:405 start_codon:yes stop_codon:yes gene_type:complete
MTRRKSPAYRLKSAAHGGPMRRNFPSAFKSETGKGKKMSKEEMEAESLKRAIEGGFEVEVSGGKKTIPGSFVQYSTEGGGESRGASIAGSSKRHTKLRDLAKDPNYKMTIEEREELRDLDVKTGKAYFRDTGGS